MDNYNDNQNTYNNDTTGSGGSNGYPVDPNNNSYSYTGSNDQTGTRYTGSTDQTQGSSYTQDRYYSPYERRTMAEDMSRAERRKQKRAERRAARKNKQHGFGMKIAKCAALAATFGLVSGCVFGGVNTYLFPQQQTTVTQQRSALSTTSQDDGSSTGSTLTSSSTTDISAIVDKAMPAIVAITNMTETEYQTWYGQTYSQESDSAGSGIIVSEDDDYLYIATNNHVVEGATTLTVQFCDDSTAAAEVKGTSPSNDLAVVQVAKSDIEQDTMDQIAIATINDEGNEKVGQQVIAIGNALGYGQSVTSGIISALNREVTAQDSSSGQTYTNSLTQTDASINPGNSGGALLNMNGEVIGINSSKVGGDYVDGVGFAIPMTDAAPIINELITREKVEEGQTGFLGISGINVDDSVAEAYNMPNGVYVAKVYDGSAAAKAGIQQGDIITAFDGEEISTMEEIQELLNYRAAGTDVKVTISRADNGQYVEQTLTVTLGSKNS